MITSLQLLAALAVTKELLKESAEALFRDFSRTSLKYFGAVEIHQRVVNWAGDSKRHDNVPLAIFEKIGGFPLAGAGRRLS